NFLRLRTSDSSSRVGTEMRISPSSSALSKARLGTEPTSKTALTITSVSKAERKSFFLKNGFENFRRQTPALRFPAYLVHRLFKRESVGPCILSQPDAQQDL